MRWTRPIGVLALLLAACGGGDGATTTGAPTTTTGAPTTTTGAPTTTTSAVTGTWFDGVDAGGCFDDVFAAGGDFDFSVAPLIVPCDMEHDNEVVALVGLDDGAYPADTLFDLVDTACETEFEAFVSQPLDFTLLIRFTIAPSETDWDAGVRHGVCAVYSGDRMIGTARSGDLIVPGEAVSMLALEAGQQQLWIIDAGSGEIIADLTTDDSPEPRGAASWAPDASTLAFTAPGAGGDADIFLVNPLNGSTVVLIEDAGNDEDPVIAPFGTIIAYVSDLESAEFDIHVLDLDADTNIRLNIGLERQVSPHWSPDGERLVFRGRADGNSDIYVIDVATEEITRLTDHPDFDGDARWSPDGSQILFSSTRAGSYDLWVMNADGSNQTQLTDHPANEEYPTWSSDGRFIAFTSNRLGFPQVWVIRADGSDESLLMGAFPSSYATFGPAGALEAIG